MATTATADRNEQLVREYVTELWQNHNFDRVPEFVADSFTYDEPTLSEPVFGAREFLKHLRDSEAAFPDFHVRLETVLADDDVVMAEWTFKGTHRGPMNGIPATGRRVTIRGLSIVRIENGTVVEDRAYWDPNDVAAQLGLDFPAVIAQLPKLAWMKVSQRG